MKNNSYEIKVSIFCIQQYVKITIISLNCKICLEMKHCTTLLVTCNIQISHLKSRHKDGWCNLNNIKPMHITHAHTCAQKGESKQFLYHIMA